MSVITSSSFAKALWPGVNTWYGKSYNEIPTKWTELFDTNTSRRAYEEDVGITSFGLAQIKPEGQAFAYDSESQAFITRFTHVVYGLGFMITREIFEDDQYDVVGQRRAQGLAYSMRQTKEIVGANVYNRAFSSSYTGGDGVSLINTAHPNFAGGTQSNAPTGGVTVALSEAALESAVISMRKWTNDRGLRIMVTPQKLIVPVDLEFEARRILGSPYRPSNNGAGITTYAPNDISVLYADNYFAGGIHASPYINANSTMWFIRTDVKDGMKQFQRREMEFGIDNDFDTENAKFKASERYSFGWTDYRALFGSNGQ